MNSYKNRGELNIFLFIRYLEGQSSIKQHFLLKSDIGQ